MQKFMPNLNTVELHITYRCDMRCANCSNLISQAPAKMDMAPDDVSKFLSLPHQPNMITVHGGEPALNPWFLDIAELLVAWKKEKEGRALWWLTNDTLPDLVAEVDAMGIPLGKANKAGGISYIKTNEAPTDVGVEPSEGCFQARDCGCAYNLMGYWPCSPMASAARVFHYRPMEEITTECARLKMLEHCKLCGFAGDQKRTPGQVTSPSWQAALKEYNG